MRYRRDIDGLRAIAVVPVVLYHAGADWLPGGFVGVDVFFVISGFLITSLIVHELKEERFSLLSFYERRIRRIFPALFVVLAFSAAVATLIFLPEDLKSFGRSLMATAFFVSNRYFYKDTGYFAAPPDTKPLLHTWSLAVEEQYYIIFPLLMILLFRFVPRRWRAVLIGLAVASLTLCILQTPHHSASAFYKAETRAWELLIGAVLAIGLIPALKAQRMRELAGIAGLALIAFAVLAFSEEMKTFPGPAALVPCLGAALLIYAGEGGTSIANRVLSLTPLVFVGLISYSLYLWHWPLLVFARYWNFEPLPALYVVGIVAASFVLAALSWRFVEKPFRERPIVIARKPLFAAAASAAVIALTFGFAAVRADGWPGRLPDEALAVTKEAPQPALQACDETIGDPACPRPSFALWGDSHAGAFKFALAELARNHGQSVKFYLRPGCPTVSGFKPTQASRNCGQWAGDTLRDIVAQDDIRTVIIASRFLIYVDHWQMVGSAKLHNPITAPIDGATDIETQRRIYAKKLAETVQTLLDAGKRVVLVYPVPELSYAPERVAVRFLLQGRDLSGLKGPTRETYNSVEANVIAMLDNLKVSNPERVIRIQPQQRLCAHGQCRAYADGALLYRDNNHLSRAGARFVVPEFESIFEQDVALSPQQNPAP